MNKIDKLINELCPNGVEYKELGETMTIVRGASPRPIQSFLTKDNNNSVNWIKIGDINKEVKYVTKTSQKITDKGALKSRFLKKGDFILSNSMSFGRPYILDIDGCIHDGWIAMSGFQNYFLPDFLYQLLKSRDIQKYWSQKASSGTVRNLNADIVRGTKVPLPPLSVQQQIVKILDNFTDLDTQLKQELENRKKQYEHYRDELLSFDEGVELKAIGEFSEFFKGASIPRDRTSVDYEIPYLHYGDVYKLYNNEINLKDEFNSIIKISKDDKFNEKHLLNTADIVYNLTSETVEDLGKSVVIINDENKTFVSGTETTILRITNKDLINSKYLNYIFMTDWYLKEFKMSITGTKVYRVHPRAISKIKIPIPSKQIQQEIVFKLDQFDKLICEIEKEIKLRHKQYEHYREMLLNFKKFE